MRIGLVLGAGGVVGQVAVQAARLLRAWDGDEGAYWATRADDFDRSVRAHHDRLMATAAIQPGGRPCSAPACA